MTFPGPVTSRPTSSSNARWRGVSWTGRTPTELIAHAPTELIRHAHAQRHTLNKPSYRKGGDNNRHTRFCKAFQTSSCSNSKDHEILGKLLKHICAFCLGQGRHMGHPRRFQIPKDALHNPICLI